MTPKMSEPQALWMCRCCEIYWIRKSGWVGIRVRGNVHSKFCMHTQFFAVAYTVKWRAPTKFQNGSKQLKIMLEPTVNFINKENIKMYFNSTMVDCKNIRQTHLERYTNTLNNLRHHFMCINVFVNRKSSIEEILHAHISSEIPRDINHNNNNIYTSLTAPSFTFGKPNRIQRPRKRRYATSAKTDWNKNVFNVLNSQKTLIQ